MKKKTNVVAFRNKQGKHFTLGVPEERDNEIWVKPVGSPDALDWLDFDGFHIDSRFGQHVRAICEYITDKDLRRQFAKLSTKSPIKAGS